MSRLHRPHRRDRTRRRPSGHRGRTRPVRLAAHPGGADGRFAAVAHRLPRRQRGLRADRPRPAGAGGGHPDGLHQHECHFCVALHTGKLTRLGATAELITALRAGTALPEPRLEALRRFTLAVLDHRGAVPDDELDDFLAAGYQPRHALDVVLGVGAYTMSTFANRLTRAPLDPPLAAHAWTPAA